MPGVLPLGIDIVQRPRMRHLTENRLQQRALAGAIRPDQRRQLAAMDMQVDMRKNIQAPDMDGEILDLRTAKLRAVSAR